MDQVNNTRSSTKRKRVADACAASWAALPDGFGMNHDDKPIAVMPKVPSRNC
jgi:hypothetical protein